MNIHSKTIAVYYHMPFMVTKDNNILANPVIGTFIDSLIPYFKHIIVLGFESVANHGPITYSLSNDKKIQFVSLGPEGQFWDYFEKMRRLKKRLKPYINKIQILLLRVPSHLAYSVWRYVGKPDNTALLFVGNPYFTPAYSNSHNYMYFFRRLRSGLHDSGMKIICNRSSTIVFANSKALVDLWGDKLQMPVSLISTSSISEHDIIPTNDIKKSNSEPFRLLFVGRICYDKGVRELFEALKELNKRNIGQFVLDIVGSLGDLGGNDINQLIQQYAISDYVKYHGVIPFGENLFKFYNNTDAYILPSYHEGMPHTIWEAMSQGTPVIATQVGGIRDNFVNRKDILFVKTKDVDSICDAVTLLKNDADLAECLSRNGNERVATVTKEHQAEEILDTMIKHWK